VYETPRDTLEGLSVAYNESLEPILHLTFPKLRILSIYPLFSLGFTEEPIFTESPIETLAMGNNFNGPQLYTPDEVENLSQLKQLVFMNTSRDDPPSIWKDACEAQDVKCFGIDYSDLYLLTVSQIHQLVLKLSTPLYP
jgi:hypothetical protein